MIRGRPAAEHRQGPDRGDAATRHESVALPQAFRPGASLATASWAARAQCLRRFRRFDEGRIVAEGHRPVRVAPAGWRRARPDPWCKAHPPASPADEGFVGYVAPASHRWPISTPMRPGEARRLGRRATARTAGAERRRQPLPWSVRIVVSMGSLSARIGAGLGVERPRSTCATSSAQPFHHRLDDPIMVVGDADALPPGQISARGRWRFPMMPGDAAAASPGPRRSGFQPTASGLALRCARNPAAPPVSKPSPSAQHGWPGAGRAMNVLLRPSVRPARTRRR